MSFLVIADFHVLSHEGLAAMLPRRTLTGDLESPADLVIWKELPT